jgi:hypothetical protein
LSGEYVKTGLTLDRNVRGEGPADYLEQKYGKDWDKLEVYKKDFIQTRNGESWLIKDVPFVKVKGEWIRTDARQVQGAQFDGSHPAFNKYQWSTTPGGFDSRTGARKDGTIFSYGASDRRDNR